jgi:hypothetical protein
MHLEALTRACLPIITLHMKGVLIQDLASRELSFSHCGNNYSFIYSGAAKGTPLASVIRPHSSFRKNTNYPLKMEKHRHSTVIVRQFAVCLCAMCVCVRESERNVLCLTRLQWDFELPNNKTQRVEQNVCACVRVCVVCNPIGHGSTNVQRDE